jgi:hypothetical protein
MITTVDVLDDEDDVMMIAGEDETSQIHQFFSKSSLRLLRLSKRCERGVILDCCQVYSENRDNREGIAASLAIIYQQEGTLPNAMRPVFAQRERQKGDLQ